MSALLERTSAAPERPRQASHFDTPGGGAHDGAPPTGGGGGGGRRRNIPVAVAVLAIVALAVLLTYLGMLTQIWANVSGAQLPGA